MRGRSGSGCAEGRGTGSAPAATRFAPKTLHAAGKVGGKVFTHLGGNRFRKLLMISLMFSRELFRRFDELGQFSHQVIVVGPGCSIRRGGRLGDGWKRRISSSSSSSNNSRWTRRYRGGGGSGGDGRSGRRHLSSICVSRSGVLVDGGRGRSGRRHIRSRV